MVNIDENIKKEDGSNEMKKFIINNTFNPNKYFIPALIHKYPHQNFMGFIETIPIDFKITGDNLVVEKFKFCKKKFIKYKLSKEKYNFNFNDKLIYYFETGINTKENHYERILYEFKNEISIKKIYDHSLYEKFYKAFNFIGNLRIKHLMTLYTKDDSKIQEMIDLDLNIF